jgi:hypothetical protein
MVGHAALDRRVGVRVPVPEPFQYHMQNLNWGTFAYKNILETDNRQHFLKG